MEITNGWFFHSYMDSLIEWYGSDYDGYGTSPENVSLFTNILTLTLVILTG